MRKGLRRIVVDGRIFLWTRRHRHFLGEKGKACEERLTLYEEGYKRSPLHVWFRCTEIWEAGYPMDGVVWRKDRKEAYNLNRPAVVEALIRHGLGEGWMPGTALGAMDAEDAYAWLLASGAPSGIR